MSSISKFREWYGRRSKEFESSNYPKYKENKEANKNVAKEYSKFERKLQFEQEIFQRKLNEKLNSMEICQPKINKKVHLFLFSSNNIYFLLDYNEYTSNFNGTKVHFIVLVNALKSFHFCSQSCRIQTVELLRPEDLLTFDDTEEIADESNSSLLPIPNTTELQLSGGFPPQLDFTFNQESRKKETEDYKKNISGIKEEWQKIEFIDSPKDSISDDKNQGSG
jgi:hypothetical protein